MTESKQEIALKQINRLKEALLNSGLKVSDPIKNEFSYQVNISNNIEKISVQVFFGRKGNKLVIQGNKDLKLYNKVSDFVFGEKFLNIDKTELEPENSYIGTDESGKGDYFGPLVVAGVCVSQESGQYLKRIGIRDSKELTDQQIKILATEIKNVHDIFYDIVIISPEKYNKLYAKMGNLNKIMGWAHARVIENLLIKCEVNEAISDKFGNEKLILDALQQKGRLINLKQVTKAEKFTAVAAASVLAREIVLKWFQFQSKKYKIKLPKGASQDVNQIAKKIYKNYGNETLSNLVKLHFKTSKKIFTE